MPAHKHAHKDMLMHPKRHTNMYTQIHTIATHAHTYVGLKELTPFFHLGSANSLLRALGIYEDRNIG